MKDNRKEQLKERFDKLSEDSQSRVIYETQKLLEVVKPLVQSSLPVFDGDMKSAINWFFRPHEKFAGETPAYICHMGGTEYVVKMLIEMRNENEEYRKAS